MLPIDINIILALLLGFILGFSVDIFNSTPGINAAATVVVAYCRPFMFRLFSSREENDASQIPTAKNCGTFCFLKYAFSLILIHHTCLFFIEAFTFTNFFQTILRIILSSFSTLFFVFFGHRLFPNK
jgi:hypothetical protein